MVRQNLKHKSILNKYKDESTNYGMMDWKNKKKKKKKQEKKDSPLSPFLYSIFSSCFFPFLILYDFIGSSLSIFSCVGWSFFNFWWIFYKSVVKMHLHSHIRLWHTSQMVHLILFWEYMCLLSSLYHIIITTTIPVTVLLFICPSPTFLTC